MRAVVLVGGFGTRLRPLTLSTPKQMLPVAGRPMIERVLAHLRDHGIDDVVLSLGYRPDAFTDAYPDGTCRGVRLHYAVEPEPLDTAGAIRFAAVGAGVAERFLVVNGDVLTDFDLGALVAFHDRAGAEGTIALTRVDDPSHFGVVPTDEAGRVLAFVEKPPPGEAPTDLVNAGFYVLEPSVLDRIPGARRVNIERETFPAMAGAGALYGWADPSYWIDVGTPERLLQANLDVLDGRRPALELDEPVGADVAAGADVVCSLLGAGSAVATSARVARSVLGPGARIDHDAVVEDALLLPGSWVGAGATVRRSILGVDAGVEAGASVEALCVLADGALVQAGTTLSGTAASEVVT